MPKIRIIPDNKDLSAPKNVPASSDLVKTVPRFRPPGSKPPLPLDRVFNRQGDK